MLFKYVGDEMSVLSLDKCYYEGKVKEIDWDFDFKPDKNNPVCCIWDILTGKQRVDSALLFGRENHTYKGITTLKLEYLKYSGVCQSDKEKALSEIEWLDSLSRKIENSIPVIAENAELEDTFCILYDYENGYVELTRLFSDNENVESVFVNVFESFLLDIAKSVPHIEVRHCKNEEFCTITLFGIGGKEELAQTAGASENVSEHLIRNFLKGNIFELDLEKGVKNGYIQQASTD